MTAGHTATLSAAVSAQHKGIVLVFSRYSSATIRDYGWVTFFLPKKMVSEHSGVGYDVPLCATNDTGAIFGAKYLYVHDTSIVGSDNNSKGNNGTWVLRYVIGV